ncbi:MAG TPA: ABC transporter permease [Vicinamibacterales bacterium]|nr:ABC transporter permease [Vicinamibacterales bacterium]
MIDSIWQDVRYAARSLARRPLVTAVTVSSLALGIGVNSALFSVFDHLLFRQLPVPAPEEIVLITSPGPRPGGRSTSSAGGSEAVFSYPLFRDLERLKDTGLSSLAAHRDFSANLAFRGQTQSGSGLLVSGAYFSALRVIPALGRVLTTDDDRLPDGQPVAVLSYDYWSRRFGGSSGVVGDTLFVNGQPMTIVGVAPEAFTGTTVRESPQVFVPLSMSERLAAGPGRDSRRNHWLYLFGRLEPGVAQAQAENRFNAPFSGLIRDVEYPALRSGLASDRDRAAFQARRIVLQDGSRARTPDRSRIGPMVALLFGVTGFVLLIACANVASLLLARATDRSHEIAVRLSMGASSTRLIRLLLTEASVLGALGGIGGIAVSKATLTWALTMVPDDRTSMVFAIDSRILAFTLVLAAATSLVFGLVPALYGARTGMERGLQAGATRTAGPPRAAARMRTALATIQIALAMALLTQAGLFIVSLFNLSRVDLGIRPEGLMTFRLSPFLNGYTPDQARALLEQVDEDLRSLPGVSSVGESTIALLGNDPWRNSVTVEGFQAEPDADMGVNVALIGPDYFKTIALPFIAGRDITRADASTAPKVAIVNEAFARKFNLRSRVIGTRLALGRGDRKALEIEIVGLVRDARHTTVREDNPPQLFLPYRQNQYVSLTYYVRSAGDPVQLTASLAAVVARADRNLPLENVRTMEEQVWNSMSGERVLATLSSSFAGLATILAGIGLYAMLAHLVARRVREMGIRIALGARRIDVQRLILTQVVWILAIGGSIGIALALGFGQLAKSILFGLGGSEPAIIAAAAVVVVLVAFAAGIAPARRASLVNPVDALRAE